MPASTSHLFPQARRSAPRRLLVATTREPAVPPGVRCVQQSGVARQAAAVSASCPSPVLPPRIYLPNALLPELRTWFTLHSLQVLRTRPREKEIDYKVKISHPTSNPGLQSRNPIGLKREGHSKALKSLKGTLAYRDPTLKFQGTEDAVKPPPLNRSACPNSVHSAPVCPIYWRVPLYSLSKAGSHPSSQDPISPVARSREPISGGGGGVAHVPRSQEAVPWGGF